MTEGGFWPKSDTLDAKPGGRIDQGSASLPP